MRPDASDAAVEPPRLSASGLGAACVEHVGGVAGSDSDSIKRYRLTEGNQPSENVAAVHEGAAKKRKKGSSVIISCVELSLFPLCVCCV